MAKLFLAIVLTVCLVYVVQCQEAVARGAHFSEDDGQEADNNGGSEDQDLWAHIKQFKQWLVQKKLNKHQQPPQQPHQQVSVNKNFKALFVQVQCEANTCPKDCPGSCGSYQGSLVCVCKHESFVNPCTAENVRNGYDLHPYKADATKYIQCGPAPGLAYIKSCPSGLVWDNKRCYCNYPCLVHSTPIIP